MQIVIDIPEEKYDRLMKQMQLDRNFSECKITPLPKGHGDLVDRNAFDIDNLDRAYGDNFELDFGRLYTADVIDMIANADTIVEADKER